MPIRVQNTIQPVVQDRDRYRRNQEWGWCSRRSSRAVHKSSGKRSRWEFSLSLLIACIVVVLTTGCRTYQDQARQITSLWVAGRATEAATAFAKAANSERGKKDGVLWDLEAGTSLRAAAKYPDSNRHFEAAAVAVDQYEQQAEIRLASEAAAAMSNQQNLPYRGQACDKIMLHTYRALNYLALGEAEKARPELIRAYQRQQDAVNENRRRIEKTMAQQSSSAAQPATQSRTQGPAASSSPSTDVREAEKQRRTQESVAKAQQDPGFNAALAPITQNLEGFRFYADYVNPFTVYLDGLFFLHRGSGGSDLERANKSLRRVAEVVAANKFVMADLRAAEDALRGQRPAGLTYVIFETGRAPSREQIRIDVPIILANVSYVGAAFPKLVFHPDYVPNLHVRAGAQEETTALVADMDAIVALDFKNEWPGILTRTLVSTTAKAVATYFINEAGNRVDPTVGLLLQIGTAIGGLAMNIADTRSWTTLPKQFQVARVTTPPDRKLTLIAPGFPSTEVVLEAGQVNVVYVRSITTSSPLLVTQFRLR